MHNLELISNYCSDDAMREKLYPLFEKVFNIEVHTLKDFHRRGFWNPTYRPFTFFDGEDAVANVSMFSMPLIIKHTYEKAAGIQSVMTHPDYRRKGLMKRLFEKMLAEIDHEFQFSLLLTKTPDLYQPFGFEVVQEHYFVAPFHHIPVQKQTSIRRLDFFNEADLQIVRHLMANHTPVSHHFSPISFQSSFYLNMYHPSFRQKLYYSEELKVMIVFEVEGETLKLYDVIGLELPALDDLCSQLPYSFNRIEFYFYPDLFNITEFKPVVFDMGNHLMVRGHFLIKGDYFKLPITAQF